MPINTNLNTAPYYDDFDEDDNFHRILFRPGFALQARELTQLQSILQNQIETHGKHTFNFTEISSTSRKLNILLILSLENKLSSNIKWI